MTSLPSPIGFRHPAVRHLVWICQAAQLYNGAFTFYPAREMSAAAVEKLRRWDLNPASGPAVLTAEPNRRLGLYFERLYECLISEVLGWDLLASNLPVRSADRTLGELDFLVRNTETGRIEHHEIAVKFYLAYQGGPGRRVLCYGPNPRDRLDLKIRRMLEHQSRLTRGPEARALLEGMNVRTPPAPRVFLAGYLFHPCGPHLIPASQLPKAGGAGRWVYLDRAQAMDCENWVELRKPHWLGPWLQFEPPDQVETKSALESIRATQRPRLFAILRWNDEQKAWIEQDRLFVVPACWPNF